MLHLEPSQLHHEGDGNVTAVVACTDNFIESTKHMKVKENCELKKCQTTVCKGGIFKSSKMSTKQLSDRNSGEEGVSQHIGAVEGVPYEDCNKSNTLLSEHKGMESTQNCEDTLAGSSKRSSNLTTSTPLSNNEPANGLITESHMKIGQKVRSKVHNIMSRLAQCNPEVNQLLVKSKQDDIASNCGMGTACQLSNGSDKGNLFNNLDNAKDSNADGFDKPFCSVQLKNKEMTVLSMALGHGMKCNEKGDEKVSSAPDMCLATCTIKRGYSDLDDDSDVLQNCHSQRTADGKECSREGAVPNSKSVFLRKRKCKGKVIVNETLSNSVICSESSLPLSERLATACDAIFKVRGLKEGQCGDDVEEQLLTNTDRYDENDCIVIKKKRASELCIGSQTKHSRLDKVIGLLGERVPMSESVTENGDYECTHSPSRTDCVDKPYEHMSNGSESASEDDTVSTKVLHDANSSLSISNQELKELVVGMMETAVEQYRCAEILSLNQRVELLKECVEEWKQRAKDLEKQILDLTVLQQRLEKRKAHTVALKSITTRNASVWVTEDKLKSCTLQKKIGSRNPPCCSGSLSTSHCITTRIHSLSQISPSIVSGHTLTSVSHSMVVAPSVTVGSPGIAHELYPTLCRPIKTANSRLFLPKTIVPSTCHTVSPLAIASRIAFNQSAVFSKTVTKGNAPVALGGAKFLLVTSPHTPIGCKVVPAGIAGTVLEQQPVKRVTKVNIIDLTVDDDSPSDVPVERQITVTVSSENVAPVICAHPTNDSLNLAVPGTVVVASPLRLFPPSLMADSCHYVTGHACTDRLEHADSTGLGRQSTPSAGREPALVNAARLPVPAVVPVGLGSPATIGPMTGQCPPLPPGVMPTNVPHDAKLPPPKPSLKITRVLQGIVLSWSMSVPSECAKIALYQLFAYQETCSPPLSSLWKKVGDLKALPLPMACTLTQFQDGNRYHFAIRAMDVYERSGRFSDPAFIYLNKMM